MAISIYLSIITLNVNELNAPKDTGWPIGLKKTKTRLYAAYKRLTSELKIHTD